MYFKLYVLYQGTYNKLKCVAAASSEDKKPIFGGINPALQQAMRPPRDVG
jgi:hypothetical protein